jgi:hypothetical protein
MCRQSADWTTASQRSASFSYSHGGDQDAGAGSQAAYDADEYTEDDGATAEPALDLAPASYAASDEPYSASEASFWQRSAAGSRAGSAGTVSAAGSRPSSAHQGASTAPDSPASSPANSQSADYNGTGLAASAEMNLATSSGKHTATRTASIRSARGTTTSRASGSLHTRGTGASQQPADRQLEAWQLDDAGSNASLSSWAAAESARLEPADEGLMVDAAEHTYDYAGFDTASLDAVAEADQATQHSSQLPEAGGSATVYDVSPADAAGECSSELDATAAALARHTDASDEPRGASGAAISDNAADEEGIEVERLNSEPSSQSSNEHAAHMEVAVGDFAQSGGSWHDQSHRHTAAGQDARTDALELSGCGKDVHTAGAAAAQLLMPLPGRNHIILAAAAAAREQLPSGGRLSVIGTGISMDGAPQARARSPAWMVKPSDGRYSDSARCRLMTYSDAVCLNLLHF